MKNCYFRLFLINLESGIFVYLFFVISACFFMTSYFLVYLVIFKNGLKVTKKRGVCEHSDVWDDNTFPWGISIRYCIFICFCQHLATPLIWSIMKAQVPYTSKITWIWDTCLCQGLSPVQHFLGVPSFVGTLFKCGVIIQTPSFQHLYTFVETERGRGAEGKWETES